MLTTGDNEIFQTAADIFAELHVNSDLSKVEHSLENLHTRVVNECVSELSTALYPSPKTPSFEIDASTPGAIKTSGLQVGTQRTTRVLKLLQTLSCRVRMDPGSIVAIENDSQIADTEDIGPDEAIRIYYEIHSSGYSSTKQSLEVGSKLTRKQFGWRLDRLMQTTDYSVILQGHFVKIPEKPDETLQEWGIQKKGMLLIRKPAVQQQERSLAVPIGTSSFDAKLLAHFELLSSYLDQTEEVSEVAFSLLAHLPAPRSACLAVIDESVDYSLAFPADRRARLTYSLLCLDNEIGWREKQRTIDAPFIGRVLLLLEHVLTSSLRVPLLLKHCNVQPLDILADVFLRSLYACPAGTVTFRDCSRLVDCLTSTLHSLSAYNVQPSRIRTIYDILLQSALRCPGTWDAFSAVASLDDLHRSSLVASENEVLRKDMAELILACITRPVTGSLVSKDALTSFYWKQLLAILPTVEEYRARSFAFFRLIIHVFNLVYADPQSSICMDASAQASLRSHCDAWTDVLLNARHHQRVGLNEMDPYILGYTHLVKQSVETLAYRGERNDATTLIHGLYQYYLFPPLPSESAKDHYNIREPLLDAQTRALMYDLVLPFSSDPVYYLQLVKLTTEAVTNGHITGFHYDPQTALRSSAGQVGIRNLGSTCYMNSLFTQLFMNVRFRKFILGLEITHPNSTQALLACMQDLFANMQEGFCHHSEVGRLVKHMRNSDGSAINVLVQMDAHEFLVTLFNDLESQLTVGEKEVFRKIYGYSKIYQIKGIECQHVRERIQPEIAIPVSMDHSLSLRDGLQAMIAPEVLEGDNELVCEQCDGRKVRTRNRSCLQDLPDSIIFHLQRFKSDLYGNSEKVDQYLEFPSEVDMAPYQVENLRKSGAVEADPDPYILTGVLVHSGTHKSGHYYSFAQVAPAVPGAPKKWVKFDDATVTDFEVEHMNDQCFGGSKNGETKHFNAYMLFYQRESTVDVLPADVYIRDGVARVPVPHALSVQIKRENQRLLRESCSFQDSHTNFVRRLLSQNSASCSEGHNQNQSLVIDMALRHLLLVCGRMERFPNLSGFLGDLIGNIADCTECHCTLMTWLLADPYRLRDMLLQTRYKTRHSIVDLIKASLLQLQDTGAKIYGLDCSGKRLSSSSIEEEGVLPRLIRRLSEIFTDLRLDAAAWTEYFDLLSSVSSFGLPEVAVVLQGDLLEKTIALFRGHHDPEALSDMNSLAANIQAYMDRGGKIPWAAPMNFINCVLPFVDFNLKPVNHHSERLNASGADGKMPLSVTEKTLLCEWDVKEDMLVVLARMFDMMRFHPRVGGPGRIIAQILYQNPDFGIHDRLASMLRENLPVLYPEYVGWYIHAAAILCRRTPDRELACTIFNQVLQCTFRTKKNSTPVPRADWINFMHELTRDLQPNGDRLFLVMAFQTLQQWVGKCLVDDGDTPNRTDALIRRLFDDKQSLPADEEINEYRLTAARLLMSMFSQQVMSARQNGDTKGVLEPFAAISGFCAAWLTALYSEDNLDEEILDREGDTELVASYKGTS